MFSFFVPLIIYQHCFGSRQYDREGHGGCRGKGFGVCDEFTQSPLIPPSDHAFSKCMHTLLKGTLDKSMKWTEHQRQMCLCAVTTICRRQPWSSPGRRHPEHFWSCYSNTSWIPTIDSQSWLTQHQQTPSSLSDSTALALENVEKMEEKVGNRILGKMLHNDSS